MKEIKAILQPHIITKVVRALHALPHFPGLTLNDARGQGRGRGAGGSFKLTEDDIDYHRKVILEVVCADDLVTIIVEVIRIRTGEKQDQAV